MASGLTEVANRWVTAEPERAEAHAHDVLELPRVLEWISRLTVSASGAERVRSLSPTTELAEIEARLSVVEEMVEVLGQMGEWSPPAVPRLELPLRRLGTAGSVLETEELRDIGELLRAARVAASGLREAIDPDLGLARLIGRLCQAPALDASLERTFDENGDMCDDASKTLGRLRRELRAGRAKLVERLEAFGRGLESRVRVPDGSITLRRGRYCLPIRREGRGSVGGIVHDESSTGRTLFVEPPIAIEPMNAIRELEIAERREVRRILQALTDELRPLEPALTRSYEAVAELDSLHARARYALEHGGTRPTIGLDRSSGAYRIVQGRHPLLLASGEPTVPFDLELEPLETVLLVSGPNAGGKTVVLKSIGLFSLLAQSGVIPPTAEGTRLPVFRRVFAMIGDEQSIEASLSTFGARVRALVEILDATAADSLVLIDEIGANTDPAEGAALAAAVLTELAPRAGLTVATTHLGALKGLAAESSTIVNGSLQFDTDELRPTYALVRDRPGRSYGLEIAGRLGLPESVLEAARSRMTGSERSLEALLGELELRQEELERLTRDAERRVGTLAPLERELSSREAALDRREIEADRSAREAAERYLLEARQQVEQAIRRLEQEYGGEAVTARQPPREAARRARGSVERALRDSRQRAPSSSAPGPTAGAVQAGGWARLRATGRTLRVHEVRAGRVIVDADGLRLTVPETELEPVAEPEPGRGPVPGPAADRPNTERRPQLAVATEVDLRGLRVDEVESVLLPALDAAIFADLPRLRIIHGKGTGALRARVGELLDADPRVPSARPGTPQEGGVGVTVVQLAPEEG